MVEAVKCRLCGLLLRNSKGELIVVHERVIDGCVLMQSSGEHLACRELARRGVSVTFSAEGASGG